MLISKEYIILVKRMSGLAMTLCGFFHLDSGSAEVHHDSRRGPRPCLSVWRQGLSVTRPHDSTVPVLLQD